MWQSKLFLVRFGRGCPAIPLHNFRGDRQLRPLLLDKLDGMLHAHPYVGCSQPWHSGDQCMYDPDSHDSCSPQPHNSPPCLQYSLDIHIRPIVVQMVGSCPSVVCERCCSSRLLSCVGRMICLLMSAECASPRAAISVIMLTQTFSDW